MTTASTSGLFTRSWWLSNVLGAPKSLPAASADSRLVVDNAVISKSSESDFKAGMCASAAHPRSGLAPMMPTRILPAPTLLIWVSTNCFGDGDTLPCGLLRWRQHRREAVTGNFPGTFALLQ